MERRIVGFHEDGAGEWVATLSCGHRRHVRHRPPFEQREWVRTTEGREGRVGEAIECRLCDRAEPPPGLQLERTSPKWDERTVPRGLLRSHRLAPSTWGAITVHSGVLRFEMASEPPRSVELRPGSPVQYVPPEVEHEVEPIGQVRFDLAFYSLAGTGAAPPEGGADPEVACEEGDDEDEGGDPACWAALVCPECGTISTDGSHRPGCAAGA